VAQPRGTKLDQSTVGSRYQQWWMGDNLNPLLGTVRLGEDIGGRLDGDYAGLKQRIPRKVVGLIRAVYEDDGHDGWHIYGRLAW
jgi:hypothetical protein